LQCEDVAVNVVIEATPAMLARMQANLHALGAIVLWASLASLGVALKQVPPFFLTGVALLIGGLLAVPAVLRGAPWRVTPGVLALGVLTLFGYHFFLFIGLRLAPAVEVNLINYLWPLLIVVLAPLYLPGVRLRGQHVVAALLGFVGAGMAIAGGLDWSAAQAGSDRGGLTALGYALALASATMWANYSLQTKRLTLARRAFPTASIGLFGLIAGVLSLLCHALLEEPVQLPVRDWALLAVTGLGPLGAAFFMWDRALKLGDAQHIGLLSFFTPLLSTALLMLTSGRPATVWVVAATVMIVGAAVLGTRE
jgi:drug/metabolite transporter (DMT)-like permease